MQELGSWFRSVAAVGFSAIGCDSIGLGLVLDGMRDKIRGIGQQNTNQTRPKEREQGGVSCAASPSGAPLLVHCYISSLYRRFQRDIFIYKAAVSIIPLVRANWRGMGGAIAPFFLPITRFYPTLLDKFFLLCAVTKACFAPKIPLSALQIYKLP